MRVTRLSNGKGIQRVDLLDPATCCRLLAALDRLAVKKKRKGDDQTEEERRWAIKYSLPLNVWAKQANL